MNCVFGLLTSFSIRILDVRKLKELVVSPYLDIQTVPSSATGLTSPISFPCGRVVELKALVLFPAMELWLPESGKIDIGSTNIDFQSSLSKIFVMTSPINVYNYNFLIL